MRDNYALYETMLLIRRFEEKLLAEFSTGKLVGTTHAYIGQEADAAAIFDVIDPDDVVFSNHRCHGHFLAYGGDPYRLAAELMGKATGLVGGRGGSQHIQWRNFYSNGIQGGIVPVTAGMALAEKAKRTNKIAIVFTGDGTLGEGVYYETMNLASLWKLPIVFVIENNRYAQTTPIEYGVSGSIAGRFAAFNIETFEIDSTDVLAIRSFAAHAVDAARSECRPTALILHTYRFAAHSKGDDVRDPEEIKRYKQLDPLNIHSSFLGKDQIDQAEAKVAAIIKDAFARAEADPYPDASTLHPIPERMP